LPCAPEDDRRGAPLERGHARNRNANPKNLIPGATGDWEVIVGMEVHAQVASQAKLFSGAPPIFGGAPNSHVSLVDAAMPGMLRSSTRNASPGHPHRPWA